MLDPIEIEGLAEPLVPRALPRGASNEVTLPAMSIEGIVAEEDEAPKPLKGARVTSDDGGGIWEAISGAIASIPSDNGTYGGFSPDAAALSLADGITFNHADELGAAVNALGGVAGTMTDPDAVVRDYETRRDATRGRSEALREEFPWSSGLGTAGGIMATLPLMAAALPSRASGGARVLQGIAEGVGFGALGAEGASDEALGSGALLDDTLEGAIAGGYMGGAFSTAGEGIRRGLGRLASGSDDLAREAAMQRVRQATGAQTPELRRLTNRGVLEDAAELMRENGLLGRLNMGGERSIQRGLGTVQEGAGDVLESMRTRMSQESVNVAPLLRQLDDAIEVASEYDAAGPVANQLRRQQQAIAAQLEREQGRLAQQLMDAGTGSEGREARQALRQAMSESRLPFQQVDARRAAVGADMNLEGARLSGADQALKQLYGFLAEAQQGAIDGIDPMLGDAVRAANREWSLTTALLGGAESAGTRAAARRAISPTDYASGLTSAATAAQNPLQAGTLGVLANKALRRVEPGLRANAYEGVQRLGHADPSSIIEPARRAAQMSTSRGAEPSALAEAPAPLSDDIDAFLSEEALPDDLDAFLSE